MTWAPVAVFAYRRPAEVARLLESLLANPESRDTPVYAFCDGPRSPADVEAVRATRAAIRGAGVPRLTLVERDCNLGLARSIVDGVTRTCEQHGRVIVLEDDLVLSPRFLAYMNAALARYQRAERVLHVSGYMYPVDLRARTDAVFLPFINSSGWATWQRAWRRFDPDARAHSALARSRSLRRRFDLMGAYGFHAMLERQLRGEIDSWAIRWYLSVFASDGLALFPAVSLVENAGVGGGATHTTRPETRLLAAKAHDFEVRSFPEPQVDAEAYGRVRGFLRSETGIAARTRRRARRLIAALHARTP